MNQPKPAAEQWRPVLGFEGYYEVSDHGRVRSLAREVRAGYGRTRWMPGQMLHPCVHNPYGHVLVILSAAGQRKTRTVHRLVLEAFVGPRPDGLEACHGPGGGGDNHLTNLRWDTHSANVRDSVADRTHVMVSRPDCPRGHALTAPNLTPNIARDGNRSCYACSLTHAWASRRRLRSSDPEWIAEANRRHAEILHFGEPIRYSNSGRVERWVP